MNTPILTANEVAELLHAHVTMVYKLARNQELPHFRIGSDLRFNRDAVLAWMTAQTSEPKRQANR